MIQKVGLVLIEIYAGMGFNGIQWDLKSDLTGIYRDLMEIYSDSMGSEKVT